MESTVITFDQLPQAVYQLSQKVDDLTELLKTFATTQKPVEDRRFTVEELSKYLPGEPSYLTIYGYVQRREIPFGRSGKRLFFLQSQIDQWIAAKQVKTTAQLAEQAQSHITRTRGRGRRAQ